MLYDYKEGKKRVDEILKNNLEVIEKKHIPPPKKVTLIIPITHGLPAFILIFEILLNYLKMKIM